ncbi:hypothetical protein OKW43_003638 [Paraburkholderia sp. WC7.3g]
MNVLGRAFSMQRISDDRPRLGAGDIVEYFMRSALKRRFKLFIQRFWQPTSACMTCMPGSWGNVLSLTHWAIAFKTGLFTGLLALLLTFTPAAKWYGNRYGNALLVGCLTAIGDAYSHFSQYRIHALEHIATGVMSGLFALLASYVFEDRARRVRTLWSRLFG